MKSITEAITTVISPEGSLVLGAKGQGVQHLSMAVEVSLLPHLGRRLPALPGLVGILVWLLYTGLPSCVQGIPVRVVPPLVPPHLLGILLLQEPGVLAI